MRPYNPQEDVDAEEGLAFPLSHSISLSLFTFRCFQTPLCREPPAPHPLDGVGILGALKVHATDRLALARSISLLSLPLSLSLSSLSLSPKCNFGMCRQ